MTNFTKYKTEIIGISAEIAIADYYGLVINDNYRIRGDVDVISQIKKELPSIEEEYEFPRPISHTAENRSANDFLLEGNYTLSVKTSQKKNFMVSPQVVGQPTSTTYFNHFIDIIDEDIPDSYDDRKYLFKKTSLTKPVEVMDMYWKYLFHCDYMIYFYDVINANNDINKNLSGIVLSKYEAPEWDKDLFTFTQTLESWNESNTVKYRGKKIGEFQVHNNRDTFKFRFHLKNVADLIEEDKLEVDGIKK